jgi:hypothetical protein
MCFLDLPDSAGQLSAGHNGCSGAPLAKQITIQPPYRQLQLKEFLHLSCQLGLFNALHRRACGERRMDVQSVGADLGR